MPVPAPTYFKEPAIQMASSQLVLSMTNWNWTVQEVPAGNGRDFCVGDVHGTFDLLKAALDVAKFDEARDRLFFVGDLIDRGPSSADARFFLAQPWAYAVRGNHEQSLLDIYADPDYIDHGSLAFHMAHNGLGWWKDQPDSIRAELLSLFAKLPIAIEVPTAFDRVGIVHAEVPTRMSWDTFKAELRAGRSNTIDWALWGRTRAKMNDQSGVPGIDRLFTGHTPQLNGPLHLGNMQIIDTAAVYAWAGSHPAGSLTFIEMSAAQLAPPVKADNVDVWLSA